MANLKIKVITPEKITFEDQDITSVTLPTAEGEITVLPNHIPLVTQLAPGEIRIKKAGKETSLVATQGFIKITAEGEITVLADYAIRSEEIEVAKVQEAKKKAEEAMKEKSSEKDFAIAEAELRRTLLELRVSQKRKSPNQPR